MKLTKINTILISLLIALALLNFRQCKINKGFDKERAETTRAETTRAINNHIASTASIKLLEKENGTLQAEKNGYKLTLKELMKTKRFLVL